MSLNFFEGLASFLCMCFYIIYAFLIGVSLMNTSLPRAILGPWMDGETEPLIFFQCY